MCTCVFLSLTLLQKPTTQSSISTTQHQTALLQFSNQAATDSLKAAVGISTTTKDNSPSAAAKEYGGLAGSYSSATQSYVAAAASNVQQGGHSASLNFFVPFFGPLLGPLFSNLFEIAYCNLAQPK